MLVISKKMKPNDFRLLFTVGKIRMLLLNPTPKFRLCRDRGYSLEKVM